MNNPQENDRPDAGTPDLPKQQKTQEGSSANFILPQPEIRRGLEPIGKVLSRVYAMIITAGEANDQ